MKNEKQCAGTYSVSGYIRNDGTEVSGYMRTCGAKHTGNTEPLQDGVSMDVPFDEIEDKSTKLNLQHLLTGKIQSYIQWILAKQLPLPPVFCKYYRLSLNYDNQKLHDKNNVYTTFNKIGDINMCLFLKEKLKDNNINASTPVVIVQFESPLYRDLLKSEYFHNVVNNNLYKIANKSVNKRNFSLSFDSLKQDLNLTLVLGKCDVYNLHYNDYFESVTGTIVDYYDYSWVKNNSNFSKALINAINNNAKMQQDKGQLTNYIIIIPFIIYNKS